MAPAAEVQSEAMRMSEQYILGMLTNLGSLPLERIHMYLSNFMAYSAPLGELRAFLQRLIKEEKIELVGNDYSKRT